MSVRGSAERLIPDGLDLGEAESMDEPTIDCQICGHKARYVVARHEIDDAGEWRQNGRVTICDDHDASLLATLETCATWQRMVITTL